MCSFRLCPLNQKVFPSPLGRSCYWHSVFAGALCYADDLMILAPSADGLRKMLEVCEEFACSCCVRLNPAKTQLIRFVSTVNLPCSASFVFCCQRLTMLDSVVHLGNYPTMSLISESHCPQSVVVTLVTETQETVVMRKWQLNEANQTGVSYRSLHYHKPSPITTNQKSKGTWCVLESPDLPRVS